jgi:trans-2,3-dihydro-3-hydroxyanthranilate isomerase
MRTYPFVTVDVFTDRRFGGNPLAVFPDARGLSDAEMQALAAEFNLSETTFVLPPEDHANSARVRIFCRTYEMAFAGHPNVGTAYVLAREGRDRGGVLRFEELAGLVEVQVDRDGTGAVTGATIAAPQPLSFGPELQAEDVAACAGIAPADVLAAAHPPILVSVGNGAFRRVHAASPALGNRLALHLYARDGQRLRARMFSPMSGTVEDPATGSANAPLGAFLLSLTQAAALSIEVVQGVEMGRPSLLRVTARRGPDGIRATVGGSCVPVLRGEATV